MIADTFNDQPKAQKSWHVVEIFVEYHYGDPASWRVWRALCDDFVEDGLFATFVRERVLRSAPSVQGSAGCTVTKFTVIIEVDGHCYAMREEDGERKMRMNLDSPEIA